MDGRGIECQLGWFGGGWENIREEGREEKMAGGGGGEKMAGRGGRRDDGWGRERGGRGYDLTFIQTSMKGKKINMGEDCGGGGG